MKKDYLSTLLSISAILCFMALMAIVVIQVVFRVLALSWKKKFAGFSSFLVCFYTVPLAMKEKAYARSEPFFNLLCLYSYRKKMDILNNR